LNEKKNLIWWWCQ